MMSYYSDATVLVVLPDMLLLIIGPVAGDNHQTSTAHSTFSLELPLHMHPRPAYSHHTRVHFTPN